MIEFISQVLSLGDGFSKYGDLWDCFWWRTDGEYAPVTFFINCNDLFWWGTADCEELTPENLPLLLESITDVRKACGVDCDERNKLLDDQDKWNLHYHSGSEGAQLFCCRLRKMRPQQPVLKNINPMVKDLYLACGPERDQ